MELVLHLFSVLLNDNIVGIGKPDGTCLLTFVVDGLLASFFHPSICSIKH